MNATLAPALAPLATRVRQRWLLDGARRGLWFGLVGAAVLVFAGRLIALAHWPIAAALLGLLTLAGSLALAQATLPDEWQVARAADRLGLDERVTSALYASQSKDPAAALLQADAIHALASLSPARYARLPEPSRWRSILLAGSLLGASLAVPWPRLGEQNEADRGAIESTRQSVEAVRTQLRIAPTAAPLTQASDAALRALDEELAQAQSVAEAAREIEKAQSGLAGLAEPEDYAQRRTAESLAAAWQGQPELSGVAQALATGDAPRIPAMIQDLASQAASLDAEQRQRLQIALQQGANAARDVPELSAALREAASAVGRGGGGSTPDRESLNALAQPLAESASHSAGVRSVQEAIAGLSQARATLGSNPSAGESGGAAATGPSSGRASSGSDGATSPSGSPAGAGDGGGDGAAAASAGSAGGGGSGQSGSGSPSGTGPGGSGVGGGDGLGGGAGAGAGGGPSLGKPGGETSGPTRGGATQAPGNPRAVGYDPIYAPSLLGGAGGPRVDLPGIPDGASGATVDLENAPLTSGAVRPYDQVYGQYAADARQALSRRPLPSGLQSLVQRYFSAIEPER